MSRRTGSDPAGVKKVPRRSTDQAAAGAVAWLKQHGSRSARDGMVRYGLPSDKAFGVSIAGIQKLARQLGPSHELAEALWDSGWYEARLLACFVDQPERVTVAQMDRWCRDFDNWGIVDTACFKLFDQSKHAWGRIGPWARRRGEFQKRAGVVLLACLALHDTETVDAPFAKGLVLLERVATDERNFVKKGVSWAIRAIGGRSAALNVAAIALAHRLIASPEAAARWTGRDVLKPLSSPALKKRLARNRK
jgi:3-methyladenine DNA glycosylase AlkD